MELRLEEVDEDVVAGNLSELVQEVADRRAKGDGAGELKLEHRDNAGPARVDSRESAVQNFRVGGRGNDQELALHELRRRDLTWAAAAAAASPVVFIAAVSIFQALRYSST